MPVVRADAVLGGRGVAQSKGVGGAARQVRVGGAPFSEEPLSSMRRTIAKRMSEAKVLCMCVCMRACVCA